MLARIFITVGGLLVLALLAALVVPYFVNWTSYRADFEREASAILGRPVKVNGEASARLLPFPSVTFSDVTVGGGPDGAPSSTIEEFSMDAELAPFLSGEILIFDMRIVRPRTVVWIDRDGRFNWAVDPRAPFAPRNIALERVTITGGEVRLVGQGVADKTVGEIDAVVSARSLYGPWRGEGTLRADGRRMRIGASTGIAGADGMRLKLRVEPEAPALAFDLEGNVAAKGGALSYAGDFRVAERPTAVEGLRGGDGKAIAAANRLAGRFVLDDKRLAVEEFRFETGPPDDPYVATGEAGIAFGRRPSFTVKATGAQVRLGDDPAATDTDAALAGRLAAIEKAIAAIPTPTMPGTVDIELPAVIAGDTTIRNVALAARTGGGAGWEVRRLTASLPGRSTLEASGRLASAPQPGFKGRLVLAVSQPSGFAAWLAKDIDAPVRRLPRAGFSADVELSREAQSFDNLELALGAARFKGTARRMAEPGRKPVLSAAVEGGAVSADELAALASLVFSDQGKVRFGGHEIEVSAKAGPVGTQPLRAAGLDVALRIADGAIDIDRLSVSDLAGAALAATGKVEAFESKPDLTLDATVVAPDLAPLAQLASSVAPGNRLLAQLDRNASGYPALLTDARLDVLARARGDGDGRGRLDLDVKGKAGGSDIAAKVVFDGERDKPLDAALSVDARLSNPDATALMALAGMPTLPLDAIGAGKVSLTAKGSVARGLDTALSAEGSGATASFAGTVLAPPDGLQARGRASLEARDIEPWLMTAGISLPGMGLGMETALAADIDYAGGLLVLDSLSGTVAEGAVSGDLNVEMRQGVPLLTGQLAADELELEPLARMVLGDTAFEGAAAGWPTTPFQQAAAAPLHADLDISAGAVSAGAGLAAYDAALSLRLDGDGLHVPELTARLQDGTLTGLFELQNSGATGLFSGQFKLSGARLESLLPAVGVEAAPLAGQADLSGALSGSGKSVGALVASLAGSGTVSLKGLVVGGFNPSAFPLLIRAADQAGRDIDARRVAAFAPGLMRSGRFAAGDADIPFTLAGGVLRMPPMSFGGTPMKLTSDLRLDINTLEVASAGQLAYAAGDDALVGSEPTADFSVAGSVADAELTFDTQPLAQFLTQRALEIEQARVEAMQAVLLEKQRLRREARHYAALDAARTRAAEEKRRAEEEAARRAAEEARLEAEARARAEEEARVKEEEARLKAEAEARAKAEEEARRKTEEEARRKAQEERAAPPATPPDDAPAPERPAPTGQPQTSVPRPAPRPAPEEQPATPAGAFPPAPTLPGNTPTPSSTSLQ